MADMSNQTTHSLFCHTQENTSGCKFDHKEAVAGSVKMRFCVFLVNRGEMFYLDADITGSKVDKLHDEIRRKANIPLEKQVLLVSGGIMMSNYKLVGHYNTGTESNPVFLFDLGSITLNATPITASKCYMDSYDMISKVLDLCPSISTLQKRCTVSQEIYKTSDKYTSLTRELIQDHHLQHQGWCSALANLVDALQDIQTDVESFKDFVSKFKHQKETSLVSLENLNEAMHLLKFIPVFKSVYESSPAAVEDGYRDGMVLYDIMCSLEKSNLIEEAEHLRQKLNELDIGEELSRIDIMYRELMESSVNDSMKSVGGLEGRFQQLERLLAKSEQTLSKQQVYTQTFEANLSRCREVADAQVLPDLCASHRPQLEAMQRDCDEIVSICRRCQEAKTELSKSLHTRLRWLVFLEKKITDINSQIHTIREHISNQKTCMNKMEQISNTPRKYLLLCTESYRRHQLTALQFGDLTLNEIQSRIKREDEHRKHFYASIAPHFLLTFFPGLAKLLPNSMTNLEYKEQLPLITSLDINKIRQVLPADSNLHDLLNAGGDDSGLLFTPPNGDGDRDSTTKKRNIHHKTSTSTHKANKLTKVDSDVLINPEGGGILLEDFDHGSDIETTDEFVDAAGDGEFLSSPFEPLDISHKHYLETEIRALEEKYGSTIKKLEDKIIQLQEQIQTMEYEKSNYSAEVLVKSQKIDDITLERDVLLQKKTSDHQREITEMRTVNEEQLHQQQTSHQDEKMKLRKRIDDLESTVSEISTELSLQKDRHEESLKAVEDELQKKIQSLETELSTALQHPSEEVCEKYRLAGELRVGRIHETEIKLLQRKLEEERENYKQYKEELTARHSEEMHELKTRIQQQDGLVDKHMFEYAELAAKTEKLKKEWSADYEARLKEKDTQLDESENRLEEAATLQIKYNRLSSEKEQCDIDNFSLTKEKELLRKTLEETRCVDSDFYKKIQSEIENKLQREFTLKLQQRETDFKKKISDLEVEHENRSQEMKKSLQAVHEKQYETQYKSQIKLLKRSNDDLQKELDRVQSSTSRSERDISESTMVLSQSGSALNESVSQTSEQVKILELQINELKQQLSSSVPLNLLDNRLTFASVKIRDQVILRFDENHKNYVILSTSTSKYFLHTDCLSELELSIADGQPHPSCIAEITDKEYCEAKKPNNRFRVRVGDRFYRVKAKPSSLNFSQSPAQTPLLDTASS